MAKLVKYTKTYNDSIVEISFVLVPKRGWFNDNVKPIIGIFKALIPATARTYDPNTAIWSFGIEYWPSVSTMLTAMGWSLREQKSKDAPVEVPVDYADNFYYKSEPTSTAESAATIAEQLSVYLGVVISTQDVTELKKLYRVKARELHPDLGGDAAKMSELNRLWTLFTSNGVAN